MKERKYKEDYALQMEIDDRGREKRVAVYKGDWYSLKVEDLKKFNLRSCLYWAVFAVFYFLYLEWNTPSTRCMYVFPLTACVLAPTVYWVMGLWQMLRAPKKMARYQMEKGIGRVLRSSVGCGVLLAMACLCDLFFMLLTLQQDFTKELPGFVWLLCAALTAFGGFAFIRDAYRRIQTIPSSKE